MTINQLIEYYENQIKDVERLLSEELRPKTRIEFSQSKRNFKRFVSELKQLKQNEL